MPIKTLHLTNSYHATSGGIRTFYTALLESANRAERFVRLVVPGEADRIEEVGEFGRIYHLAAPRSPWVDSRYRLILPHRFLWPGNSLLRQIIRDEQPDLVEICDKWLLCWLAGALRRGWIPGVKRPVLVSLSCERLTDNVAIYLSASPLVSRLASAYATGAYGRIFDVHIAVSEYVAAELTGDGCGSKGAPIDVRVVPHGVDAEGLGPEHRNEQARQGLIRQIGGRPNTVLLLYAGRLNKEKNLPLLVEMMESLAAAESHDQSEARAFHLLVAGSGPELARLEVEVARRAPGRIHFLGQVADRHALASLLSNSDAFVHPNPREPFGIGPLEAMASGLPLVAPNAGGVLTYANAENAWLVPPTGEEFAAAVQSLVADPASARCKTANARKTAEHHNWHRTTTRFFQTYDALYEDYRSSGRSPHPLECDPTEHILVPVR